MVSLSDHFALRLAELTPPLLFQFLYQKVTRIEVSSDINSVNHLFLFCGTKFSDTFLFSFTFSSSFSIQSLENNIYNGSAKWDIKRTSSFFSFSASSLMSLSRSSLIFLSLTLVSDRKLILSKESMNWNTALRRGIVSAA